MLDLGRGNLDSQGQVSVFPGDALIVRLGLIFHAETNRNRDP